MSMHNNFYYIICMFRDTLYKIQVPNFAFIQSNDILIIYIHKLNFIHELFNLLIS